ncbi:hypothetical protein FJZ18_04265 [Candidatus Pacearchaeota archaeon]|nr:hypothetical protein [Candidatus Pacearchaeota archaeon]
MGKVSGNGSVRAFHFASIIFAVSGILLSLYLKFIEKENLILSILSSVLFLTILIWSIVALALFIKEKRPKKVLVLPIYYLAFMVIIIIASIIIAASGTYYEATGPGWTIISIVSSLFEGLYALYILRIFKGS